MSNTLIIYTTTPNRLLAAIKTKIDDESIVTWEYDADGDFTHSPEQWLKRAWLRPEVSDGKLEFKIIWPKGKTRNDTVYSVYHGRFIEMILAHFKSMVTTCAAKP